MEYLTAFNDYQNSFGGDALIEWMDLHTEVPVFAVSIYLAIIFKVPDFMKDSKPLALRAPFALWNLLLSSFSLVGTYYTLPRLIKTVYEKGYLYAVCTDPKEFYFDGATGFWVALFILSKIPELLDTVFLVLQKKPVIFLHWFHHVTVMLYCWHAYRHRVSNGLWFAAINYSIHSVMYAYYFAMAINLKQLVKPIAPFITTIQLLQMFIGVAVTVTAYMYHIPGDLTACHAVSSNIKMALAMYASYAVLFAQLFYRLYLSPDKKKPSTKPGSPSGSPSGSRKTDEDICAVAGVSVSKVDDVSSPKGNKAN